MSAELTALLAKLSNPGRHRVHRIADLIEDDERFERAGDLAGMSKLLGFRVVQREYRVGYRLWVARRSFRRRRS